VTERPASRRQPSGSGTGLKVTPGVVLWGAIALVGLVLLLQNTDQTTVELFGFVVEMPLFLLIAASMLIGWLLGTLGWWLFRRRQAKRAEEESKPQRGEKGDPDAT
jgi:uncharacterized integral membrane protein